MQLFILSIITTWSFSVSLEKVPPQFVIVNSPNQAAMHIYNIKSNITNNIEPDKREYKLYEVDLNQKKVSEVRIPTMTITFI